MKASLLLVSALLLTTAAEAYDGDYRRDTTTSTSSDQYRTPEQREFHSRAAENTYESTGRSMRDKYIRASNTSGDTYQDQRGNNYDNRTRE